MTVVAAERRRDPRARVKVRMEVVDVATGRTHVLHTTNLSCSGASCTTITPMSSGTLVEGRLYLPLSEAGRDVDVALCVRGLVVRTSEARAEVGIAFDPMTEADRAELAAYLFEWLADDRARAGEFAEELE
jgi:hypothetical protein